MLDGYGQPILLIIIAVRAIFALKIVILSFGPKLDEFQHIKWSNWFIRQLTTSSIVTISC